ncbi:MAG: fumarate hydratase [Candidatus Nanopelagicales bacterium]
MFMEVSGEALRHASRTAVLAAREGAPGTSFDVTVHARRGRGVLTSGDDETWIAAGVADAYSELSATPTVVSASGQWPPADTVVHQPAILEIRQMTSGDADRYGISYLVTADGALRGRLFQETKATLNPSSWTEFLLSQVLPGLAGLPRPFRVALAVGGTSAEASLGTAASADARELDHLGEDGGEKGTPIRQRQMEAELAALLAAELRVPAGEPVCSQVRIIRLVRHGGSLPIGLYVGLTTDRRIHAALTPRGIDVSPVEMR